MRNRDIVYSCPCKIVVDDWIPDVYPQLQPVLGKAYPARRIYGRGLVQFWVLDTGGRFPIIVRKGECREVEADAE